MPSMPCRGNIGDTSSNHNCWNRHWLTPGTRMWCMCGTKCPSSRPSRWDRAQLMVNMLSSIAPRHMRQPGSTSKRNPHLKSQCSSCNIPKRGREAEKCEGFRLGSTVVIILIRNPHIPTATAHVHYLRTYSMNEFRKFQSPFSSQNTFPFFFIFVSSL